MFVFFCLKSQLKGVVIVMKKTYEILIGADVFATPSNEQLFIEGDIAELLGTELFRIIKAADFRIFNLEGPLTDLETPIFKDGPVLRAPERVAYGLRMLGTNLAVLANNHILDHGQVGVERTTTALDNENIPWIGIGKNEEEIKRFFTIAAGDKKVGVINCCEHEYSVVEVENEWSANAYDPLDIFDEIEKLKTLCDYVVVLYHGGKEKFRYPSPKLKRVFRKFADKGADIVIAQHTHCIGCYELYNQAMLLYGQGNFIFDRADNEFYSNGLLVKLSISEEAGLSVEFIPIVKNRNVVRMAKESEKDTIISELEKRSINVHDDKFLKSEYVKNSSVYINDYLITFHGRSIISKILLRLNKGLYVRMLRKYYYTKKNLAYIYNFIRCEAHHELFECGIKGMIEEKKSE